MILHTSYPAYEDGTDRVFRNVGIQQSDAGEIPKEYIQDSKHGESLKSRIAFALFTTSFIFKKTTFYRRSAFLLFVWFLEKQLLLPDTAFATGFITETECVYCSVRT